MDDRMTVAVYGATGHTGRFVVAELARRGVRAIRIGRDAARGGRRRYGARARTRRRDRRSGRARRRIARAAAVINCAYLDTALPLADAALRPASPIST